jgi:hypothetical protein
MRPCVEHRVGDFAIDVELELPSSSVADPDWTSALKTRQPRHLPFRQTPFTAKAIHNLQRNRGKFLGNLVGLGWHGSDKFGERWDWGAW